MAAANKFTNRARLTKRLAAIPDAVKSQALGAMVVGGREIAHAMQEAVPVKSGKLHDSIRLTADAAKLMIKIGAGGIKAFYARMVEFGTPRNRAQPFFFNTYRALKAAFKRRVADAIKIGVRKAAAGS